MAILPPINDKKEKEGVLRLFSGELVNVLAMGEEGDTDLITDFNVTLIRLILDDQVFKQELERALYENKEELTTNTFVMGDNEVSPTIGNWLKDFLSREGSGFIDNVALSRYISDSPNIRRVSPEEKEIVRKLIRLYRNLKFFPESMADRIVGEWEIIPVDRKEAQGPVTVTPLGTAVEPRSPLEQLKDKYNNYRRERAGILRVEDQLLVRTKGDIELVKKEFATAARNSDKNTVIACLMIMARQGALFTALRDNPAWFSAVSEYVQKKYTGQYKPDEVMYAVSNMKLEPSAVASISEFLQYILLIKMQLPENEAALIGVEIGQILGSSYQGIAYGNQETGSFEWSKNKIVDKKLVSEV